MDVHALKGLHVLTCSTKTATVFVMGTAGRSAAALGAAEAVAVALHAVARHAVLGEALGALVPVLLHELRTQRVIQLHGILRIQGIALPALGPRDLQPSAQALCKARRGEVAPQGTMTQGLGSSSPIEQGGRRTIDTGATFKSCHSLH